MSAGLGYEHNEVFESAVTPRVSVAVYLRNPARGSLGETKLTFNAGKGIKAPAIYQEQSSLFTLLQTVPAALRPAVSPIGPERSRSIDVGIEQGFADGSARIRASYFMNRFEDLIEYVSKNVLPQVGVPPALPRPPSSAPTSTRRRSTRRGWSLGRGGGEPPASADGVLHVPRRRGHGVVRGQRARTRAEPVDSRRAHRSLLAARWRAAVPAAGELGSLLASYSRGPVDVTLSAFFSGKRDSSTFLSDQFFGNSLLLPNKDLEAAYQKVDLAAAYRVYPRLKAFMSLENLLDKEYAAAAGFPALPLTARFGVTVDVGGRRQP